VFSEAASEVWLQIPTDHLTREPQPYTQLIRFRARGALRLMDAFRSRNTLLVDVQDLHAPD